MIKAANFRDANRDRYFLGDYPAVYLDTYITNLIGDFKDEKNPAHLESGQALVAEYGAGIALTHAHPVDQWQIYLTGEATLGKKPVSCLTVQYTDAWVPYGPIEVSEKGFALIALWPRPNEVTYVMPDDVKLIRANLKNQPQRILFANLDAADGAIRDPSETSLIEEGDVWARRWQLPPGAALDTPLGQDGGGGGQFFVPLAGEISYDGETYPPWSAIYIGPDDGSINLCAGAQGVDLLGLQFEKKLE